MKEVTYDDWLKNPTPREMWVWDDRIKNKIKRKVVYIMKGCDLPVIAVNEEQNYCLLYKHSAEIEEPKTRRMTNQELAWWLQDGKHREWSFAEQNTRAHPVFEYYDNDAGSPVRSDILIRENGEKWHELLVEMEE